MSKIFRHRSLVNWQACVLCLLLIAGTAACDPGETTPGLAAPAGGANAATAAGPDATVGERGGLGSGSGTLGGGTAGGTSGGTSAAPIGGASDAGTSAQSPWCAAKQVFDRYCISCHDGQGTAGTPMGLKNYADFTADSVQYPGEKVFTRALTRMKASTMRMPPQGTVSPAELALVEAWAQAGAPAGGDATCGGGTAPQAELEWPKDCEKFYKVLAHDPSDPSKPYRVEANLESHPKFVVDAPWGSDEVQALAFRPVTDNKRVLHHWILYQNSGGAFLTGWAPGQDAAKNKLPGDVGMYLPNGSQSLLLDMHYNNLLPGSKEELDASGVEICVVTRAKFRPNTASVFMGFRGIGLPMVPANTANYDLTGECSVTASAPVHLLSASPHAHKLATHTKFTVQKSDGQQIVMHDEAFDFEEQVSHDLPSEVVLETGDKVITTCRFTNPTNQDIQFGENTDNEMCFNFANYYPKDALGCDLLGGLLGGGGAGGLLGGLFGP